MATVELGYDLTKTYTSLTPTPKDIDNCAPALGTIYESTDGKAYRFVVNNHSAALVIGNVVFLNKTADYPNAVSVVNTDSCGSLANALMAGAAMGAIPAAGYGWIQFAGVGSANVEGTTDVVVGDSLKGVDSQVYVIKGQALAAAADYVNHMRALVAEPDAGPTVNANGVFINCRNY